MDFKALSNPITISADNPSKPSFFQKIRSPFSKLSPGSKKPAAIVLTVFVLFALALGIYLVRKPTQLVPQAAEEGVAISLKPVTVTASANQEFNIDVFIDTNTSNFKVTAVKAKVNYDPAKLELKSSTLKDFLPVVLQQPQNTSGSVTFTVGSTIQSPITGSGTVATLTFKALGTTTSPPTEITFDSTETAIAAADQTGAAITGSVAKDFTPSTVTFGSQASIPPASNTPEVSFTLEKPSAVTIPPGQEFSVKVLTRSDIDNANLWNATINFPKDLLEVVRFNKTNSFITNWTEEYYNNQTGEISLTGGVTNPGFKTNLTQAEMITIVFKAKDLGPANITLVDPSNIYRNSDNQKILQIKRNITVQIDTGPASPSPSPSSSSASPSPSPSLSPSPSPSPSSSPSPSPIISPSPSPSPRPKGDGNNDGKIDLQDLSIMFSKWSPAVNITSHFTLDFDDNLRINSFDYSAMKALLLQLGIIRQ